MAALWHNLRQVWTNTDWSWIVLWFGLTLLVVALIVLVRTRWGQSQPLGKCAILSLLAHLLLAIYATTVQIVVATSGGGGGPLQVSLVDGEEEGDADRDYSALTQPHGQSTDAAVLSSTGDSQPARLDIAPRLAPAPPPLLNDRSADLASRIAELTPFIPQSVALPQRAKPTARGPAQPIDEPQAESRTADTQVAPEVPAPERIAPANTDLNPRVIEPVDASSVAGSGNDYFDPSAALPADIQLKPGVEGAFRPGGSRPTAVAATPLPAGSADRSTSPGAAGNGASSLLVPVKTENAGDGAVPPIYQDRVAGDREAVARRRGGSAETEAAVQAALAWLAANQSTDGRWDADRFGAGVELSVLGQDRQGAGAHADTATTGLALLAFLGAGQTHLSGKYKDNVKRALEHLLNAQAQDGNLGGDAELFAFMYSHGIATLALSEAFAMTGDKRLEKSLRAAIDYTLASQHPSSGGWRYRLWSSSPSDPGDTSQLGWQLMALKSAELSGMAIPDKSRDGMVRFLKSVSSGQQGGLASYRMRERISRPMTAEALVCRQFLGMKRDNPAANEAGDYLLGELPNGDQINLYYWYYGTLGMYQLQGDYWRRWNVALQDALLKRQVTTGPTAGSWEPDCVWAGYGGRVYSTAMATLCLEVYYRYLPLYGEIGPELREAKRPQPR